MVDRLAGKVAIVTGAASGQGAETARRFVAEGARVAAFDVQADALEALAAGTDGRVLPVVCDVADSTSVQQGIATAVEHFGPVGVLFNCAGVSLRKDGPWDESQDGAIGDITEEIFDTIIGINLRGQFLMCKYAIPHLLEAGGGAIINVASVGGVFVGVANNAYCVSKAGILGLTRALAFTYGPRGIRSNILCPGFIETPMIDRYMQQPELVAKHLEANPLGRIGQPSEIAGVAAFLASDDASYVNGAVLPVDGGAVARSV